MTRRVTAALIVRDEARHLEACLASLASRVDEIVVADTGSADDSCDVARAAGARVVRHAWRGDFAAARNAALDAATGDWILYIDADERLDAWERATLDPLLGDDAVLAMTVKFRPQTGYTRYREHRLFRRRPDVRFRGIIHESILPDLDAALARDGGRVLDSDVSLIHLGYDGDLTAKHRRNVPLLEARLADEPDHVYSRDHLGVARLALGDAAGAEREFRRAALAASARARHEPADALPFVHLASLLLDRGAEARDVIDAGRSRFPDDHALAWLDARASLTAGDPARALPMFAALAEVDPHTLCMPRAYDVSIFGANAHAAAALCLFRLGRYDESAARYAKAEALAPDNPEFRVKRQLAEARARQ